MYSCSVSANASLASPPRRVPTSWRDGREGHHRARQVDMERKIFTYLILPPPSLQVSVRRRLGHVLLWLQHRRSQRSGDCHQGDDLLLLLLLLLHKAFIAESHLSHYGVTLNSTEKGGTVEVGAGVGGRVEVAGMSRSRKRSRSIQKKQ